MVSLKSPQILTETLSCLSTGTIGAAQSANWTGLIIPSATSLSNSFSTEGTIEYGNERTLQNRGETPGIYDVYLGFIAVVSLHTAELRNLHGVQEHTYMYTQSTGVYAEYGIV